MKVAEAFHPAEFIREEMEARGWDLDELAMRMVHREYGIARLAIEMYLELGPGDRNIRIGEDMGRQLSTAFDVSPDLFTNLEASWLTHNT